MLKILEALLMFPANGSTRFSAVPVRSMLKGDEVPLIALLAAGMAAQAVQFLDAAGLINVLGERLWDSSAWLPQDSIVGRLLHTLASVAP